MTRDVDSLVREAAGPSVLVHRCGAAIRTEVDERGVRHYLTADGSGFIAACPRCKRRLTRQSLRPVSPETVRGGWG